MDSNQDSENSILPGLAKKLPPSKFSDCCDYLRALHELAVETHGRYSYRKMAEDLGFSFTNTIHLFAQGRRAISKKAALRIAEHLQLAPRQRQYFLNLVTIRYGKNLADREEAVRFCFDGMAKKLKSAIEQDHLAYYQEYHLPIIREMVAWPEFQWDAEWIAQRCYPKISPSEAARAMKLLENLEMVVFNEQTGRHELTSAQLETASEVASLAVLKYHQRCLEVSQKALTNLDSHQRHITSLTLCVDPEQVHEIREAIEGFHSQLLKIESERKGRDPDQVVQLNIQLIPGAFVKGNPP